MKNLRMHNSRFLFYTYYWQISWHDIRWKLSLRVTLDKCWQKRCHECGQVIFPGTSYDVSNFLIEMLTFKQAIMLTFGSNKFGKCKGQCKIYRPEYIFGKNHVIKLRKSLTNFKSITNKSFKFISFKKLLNNMY